MRNGCWHGKRRALYHGAAGFQGAFAAGSGGVSAAAGNLLIRKPPIEEITNQNLNLVGPCNPLEKGQALVTSDTGLDTVTQSDLMLWATLPGIPLALEPGATGHSGVRGDAVRRQNEIIRCRTVDGEARNVIKLPDHDFDCETSPGAMPFGTEEQGFLLTCSGQSAINIFTACSLNGNFVFVPVEHRRHRNNDHVPRVRFQVRPDGRKRLSENDSPPDTEKFPR